MAILDIFKKKRTKKKAAKSPVKVAPKTEPVVYKKSEAKKDLNQAYAQISKPHISEKATMLGKSNQYVFDVLSNASKHEIKKAVESLYNVNVIAVKIINIPGKARRKGGHMGFQSGYKKAIVRIKEGQKIEII